ncbi:MAG: DUF3307 domain-containing protein [Bacteroidota bacterium]|nr:DUF3307 domain-containing protein [Bacteroidota bacterium]
MNDISIIHDLSILIRLLLAHIVADFIFQTKSMVNNRDTKHWKSLMLIYHVLVHAILVYVVLWDFNLIWPALLIMLSHYCIDLVKSYQKENIYSFLANQLAHVIVLIVVWIILRNIDLVEFFKAIVPQNKPEIWLYLFSFILLTWPVGIIISKLTYNWQSQFSFTKGLPDAGKWIGMLERMLILIFVLINQYAGIGFLIAAKSILRFNDIKSSENKKEAEYILIGTMLNFTIAIVAGLAVKLLILKLTQV